jgi:hypothetical protein
MARAAGRSNKSKTMLARGRRPAPKGEPKKKAVAKSKPTAPKRSAPRLKAPAIPHMRITAPRDADRSMMGMAHIGSVTQAGNTEHFNVSYLTSLGQKGAALAGALLQTCERDFGALQGFFGGLTPLRMPFVVQVTPGATGASHSSCLGTDIMVGGKSGSDVDFIRSLLVAEADEVFMANLGKGWDCGASPGEGLSRVLANDLYKGVEPSGFISSNVWLNERPRPNFIDEAAPTDTDYPSIGCSVLYLNWLRYQRNFSWDKIIAAGGETLVVNYRQLTGSNTGWADFSAFMEAKFPSGRTYNLNTDNPFPV